MNLQDGSGSVSAGPDDQGLSGLYEIRIFPDVELFALLNQSATYMGISREDLVLKILKFWEKNNQLPLQGRDRLCIINTENNTDSGTS